MSPTSLFAWSAEQTTSTPASAMASISSLGLRGRSEWTSRRTASPRISRSCRRPTTERTGFTSIAARPGRAAILAESSSPKPEQGPSPQPAPRLRRLALGLLAALCTAPAHAHKPSDSYLALSVEGDRIAGQWDIALRDLDFAIGLDA